jgi:hypothetical protein
MSLYVTTSVADLAAIQMTAIGVAVTLGLVATTAFLAAAMRRAKAKFRLTPSVRTLPGSRLGNAREPRSSGR